MKVPKRIFEDTDDSVVIVNEKAYKNTSQNNQSNKQYQIQTNEIKSNLKYQTNSNQRSVMRMPAFYNENMQIAQFKNAYLESMGRLNGLNRSNHDLDVVVSTSNTPKRQKSKDQLFDIEIPLSTSNTPKKEKINFYNQKLILDAYLSENDHQKPTKKQKKQQKPQIYVKMEHEDEKRQTSSLRKQNIKEFEELVIAPNSPTHSQSIQKMYKNIKIEDDNSKVASNQDLNIRKTRYSSFNQLEDIPRNVRQSVKQTSVKLEETYKNAKKMLKQVIIKKIEIFTCEDPERRVTRGMIRPSSEDHNGKQLEQPNNHIPIKSKGIKKEYFQDTDDDPSFERPQLIEELQKPIKLKIEKKEKKEKKPKIAKSQAVVQLDEEQGEIAVECPEKEKLQKVRTTKTRKTSSVERSFDMVVEKEKSKKIIKKTKCSTDKNIQIYMDTIESLQDYSLPTMIPCREKEKKYIKDYLVNALDSNGSGHSLYISGVPGIGKTASLLEIMRVLQSSKKYKNSFTFITTNGMNLQTPENLYSIILKDLTGIQAQKNVACQILQDIFTRGSIPKKYHDCDSSKIDKIKVILLDELDYLYTNDQQLLYNLFDWPHYKQSKLIVIGIANTMDFPERLKHKIASRIGNQRLVFNPYNNKQIAEIIQSRLSGLENVFDNNAVELASKKIAASSSDIRKTLNVCRKAAELCMQEYKEKNLQNFLKVGMAHVNKAYYLLYDKTYHKCLPQLSIIHKILLLAISLEVKSRSQGNAYLMDTYDRSRQIYNNFGLSEFPNKSEIESILYQLESIKLISTKDKLWIKKNPKSQIVKDINNETKISDIQRVDPHQKSYQNIADLQIILHLQVDDITNALRDDEIFIKFQHMF